MPRRNERAAFLPSPSGRGAGDEGLSRYPISVAIYRQGFRPHSLPPPNGKEVAQRLPLKSRSTMRLEHLDFTGPAIDDPEILGNLPKALAALLEETNGFVQYGGGLHVR